MAKQNKHTGLKVLGLAAAAAAAAGTYYFYGAKNAAKNRAQLKSWAVKARGEVMEKIENLKDISEKTYNTAVDQVVKKYKKMKQVAPKELAALQKELKGSWKAVKSEVAKHTKKGKNNSKPR
jgi:hypothetical protein